MSVWVRENHSVHIKNVCSLQAQTETSLLTKICYPVVFFKLHTYNYILQVLLYLFEIFIENLDLLGLAMLLCA